MDHLAHWSASQIYKENGEKISWGNQRMICGNQRTGWENQRTEWKKSAHKILHPRFGVFMLFTNGLIKAMAYPLRCKIFILECLHEMPGLKEAPYI